MKRFIPALGAFIVIVTAIFLVTYYLPFGITDARSFHWVFGVSIVLSLATCYQFKLSIPLNVIIYLTFFLIIYILTDEITSSLGHYILYGGMLVVGVIAASITGKRLREFVEEYNAVALIIESNTVLEVNHVRSMIESEFARGIRYGYPISVIQFVGDPRGKPEIDVAADILTKLFKEQISANQLSKFLQEKCRVTDILVHRDGTNQYLLLCPGIESDQAKQLTDRLDAAVKEVGLLDFSHKAVSFPSDARSFDAILELLDSK
jgi:hypothetical protein